VKSFMPTLPIHQQVQHHSIPLTYQQQCQRIYPTVGDAFALSVEGDLEDVEFVPQSPRPPPASVVPTEEPNYILVQENPSPLQLGDKTISSSPSFPPTCRQLPRVGTDGARPHIGHPSSFSLSGEIFSSDYSKNKHIQNNTHASLSDCSISGDLSGAPRGALSLEEGERGDLLEVRRRASLVGCSILMRRNFVSWIFRRRSADFWG
jgi:hypothetical protein